MISTLDAIMTVRLLLTNDVRRFVGWFYFISFHSCTWILPFSAECRQVLSKAFDSWNDQDYHRRFRQMKLIEDVSDNYEPKKQVRSVAPKNVRPARLPVADGKSKKRRARAIQCKPLLFTVRMTLEYVYRCQWMRN